MDYRTEEEMKEMLEDLIKDFSMSMVANRMEARNIKDQSVLEDVATDLQDVLMDSELLEEIDSTIGYAIHISDEYLEKRFK